MGAVLETVLLWNELIIDVCYHKLMLFFNSIFGTWLVWTASGSNDILAVEKGADGDFDPFLKSLAAVPNTNVPLALCGRHCDPFRSREVVVYLYNP